MTAYRERGYPERELQDTCAHVRAMNRDTLLQKKTRVMKTTSPFFAHYRIIPKIYKPEKLFYTTGTYYPIH